MTNGSNCAHDELASAAQRAKQKEENVRHKNQSELPKNELKSKMLPSRSEPETIVTISHTRNPRMCICSARKIERFAVDGAEAGARQAAEGKMY